MKFLWRISNHCDLQGLGGERASGRWHTLARGKRVVYLSEHPALALIEVLANLKGDPKLFPSAYQLMKIAVSDSVSTTAIPELAPDWRMHFRQTQLIGNAWLAAGTSTLLAIPSVPAPESTNYLLNPLHTDFRRISVEWCRWISYDERLFRLKDDK